MSDQGEIDCFFLIRLMFSDSQAKTLPVTKIFTDDIFYQQNLY